MFIGSDQKRAGRGWLRNNPARIGGTRRPRAPFTTAMKLGLVIPAAGAGRRLGGAAKALIVRGGATFLETIAATAREVGVADAVVVVGPPYGDAVAGHARSLGLRVAVNHQPERGMASSIAIGFAAIAEGEADAAWLWPVDHPGVTAATLWALAAALGAHEVARPRFGQVGGHPPLVGRALWPRLAGCTSLPAGARTVFAAADVIDVAVDDAGVIRDVDEPGDEPTNGAVA
jgi:CTP:molybdopterin cytidylyltransferase MocA